MKFDLFSTVVLVHDLSESGFRRGDVATVVEQIPATPQREGGYLLEVFDASGSTIDVISVLESEIEFPKPDAVVNYREYEKAA
ncbi:MAG: DUF4926 domain-containing protein [Sphingobacteriaceae bacterium]|nr:DUF4926 domain-containing protein [Cytophagaceae bacterium]